MASEISVEVSLCSLDDIFKQLMNLWKLQETFSALCLSAFDLVLFIHDENLLYNELVFLQIDAWEWKLLDLIRKEQGREMRRHKLCKEPPKTSMCNILFPQAEICHQLRLFCPPLWGSKVIFLKEMICKGQQYKLN